MRMNSKNLFALSVFTLIFFSGCVQPYLIENFSFNSSKGICATNEKSMAEITLNDNKLKFSGFIVAPTPCYELKASYSVDKVNPPMAPETELITVTITKSGSVSQAVCVQCIGEIPFNGEITINREMWGSGNYGVQIVYEGKEIGRLYNYVT